METTNGAVIQEVHVIHSNKHKYKMYIFPLNCYDRFNVDIYSYLPNGKYQEMVSRNWSGSKLRSDLQAAKDMGASVIRIIQ